MSVELVQSIDSSKVFGGTKENISVYEDRVVIYIPNQQGPKTEELYYSQISGVHLFTGLLYATLSLSTRSGSVLMVRWLPKSRAIRVADYIREHV